MEFVLRVGLDVAGVVAYLAAGAGVAAWLRHRGLRRFGRDAMSLAPAERLTLAWVAGLVALGWPLVLLLVVAAGAASWADQALALVLARRWYSHLSTELDASPWQCTLSRGRHRDDAVALEQTYARTAPPAGPMATATGTAGWAEIHTATCPGCGLVLYRIALVARRPGPHGGEHDPLAPGEVVAATEWLPQEHDAIWAARGTAAGTRALSEYLTTA